MLFKDMAEFELRIQLDRLKYIETLLDRKTYCDFPPRKIYIEPTNICNLRCVHCVHNGTMKRTPGYLDLGLFKNMIDQVEHLRLHTKLQFTGVGEPLLHKHIFDMINYASKRGFFTLMNTNATLLTDEKAEQLVDSGLDYLHISLDGITKTTYEKIRLGGNFFQVIDNIFRLFEVRYKKEGYHLAVILGIIDQERNRDEMKSFFEYFVKFPFHHVVAGELFNHMGAIEEASDQYKAKATMSQKNYPICNTPWDLLSFNCDGKAVGCNYDFDNRYVIGDAKAEKVLDIWNNDKMREFRESVLKRNYSAIEKKGKLCSECTIKWQKDYHIPNNFSAEIARMEQYLVRALKRCAFHKDRNAKFREQEAYIQTHKASLTEELVNLSQGS